MSIPNERRTAVANNQSSRVPLRGKTNTFVRNLGLVCHKCGEVGENCRCDLKGFDDDGDTIDVSGFMLVVKDTGKELGLRANMGPRAIQAIAEVIEKGKNKPDR